MKNTPSRFAGFTLIELLVVISVIGILAALLLANFAGIRDRGDDASRKSNLKQLQSALRLMYNDAGSYPTTGAAGISCDAISIAGPPPYAIGSYMQGDIATQIPGCRYRSTTTDTFTACVPLNNTNDREREAPTGTDKCPNDPTMTGTYFCVCAN